MLINLRNALMAGRRLPYDAEVEFLESTGTQWIDTGVVVNSLTSPRLIVGIYVGYVASNTYPVGGDGSGTNERFSVGVLAGRRLELRIGTYYNLTVAEGWYTVELDGSDGNGYVDGVLKYTSSTYANLRNNTSRIYFGRVSGGGALHPSKISFLQVFDGNTLVRDYIPVRKGTTGYLYDRVSGKLFGNAGSGDFILGPDVVPVEYIESHGTEYIDTGVVGGSSSKVEIVASSSNTSANYALLGARDSSGYLNSFTVWQCANNKPRFDFTASTADVVWAASGSWNTSGYNSIAKDGPLNTLNGMPCTSNTEKTFSCNFPFYLFSVNTNGTNVSNFVGRMKTCRIFSDSIPIRSFLPVRVGTGSTWNGAMIDTLTRRIYRNAGTGAFGYGNDLKYPIPAE